MPSSLRYKNMLSRPTPSGRDEGITKLAPSPPPQFSDSRFPQGMSLDPRVGLKPRTARRSTGFATVLMCSPRGVCCARGASWSGRRTGRWERVSELNPKLALGSSFALIVVQIRLLHCRIGSATPCAAAKQCAPSELPAVEGRWDISRRLPASEGFCYEFHVRAPGLVAARQHYAAGSCTLTNMDRLGNGELCVLQGRYTAERPLPVWIPLAKLHSPMAHSPESLGLSERESFGHDRSIMKPGVTTATLPAFSTLEPPVTIQQF
ncbi:hypothetical protein SCAR479_11082 [Seiridium cardinale]|uniref:Uncharacterized protein n=1 Tax=Seiridium cardinale TaxID=138064 RepID=A0ABR2XEN6_9PEZI